MIRGRRRFVRTWSVAVGTAFAVVVALVAGPAQALAPTTPDSAMWGVNGRVRAILETPSAIYIGGQFSALVSPSGQTVPRQNLAAIDPATGQPLPFAPAMNRIVFDIAVSPDGATVYASGTFTKVGATKRGRVAAWSVSNGSLLPYDVQANAAVEALVVTSDTVYLGGAFTSLGQTSRSRIAASNRTGTVLAGFNPGADETVHDMMLAPGRQQLVVGGFFSVLGGQSAARRMALVSTTNGAVTPMAERVPYEVFAVEATPTQIFIAAAGGGGHVHAYDMSTRKLQWFVLANGDAHSVTYQNGVLYAGGHFTAVGGKPASHVAALSPTTGQSLNWPIKVNSNLGVFITSTFNGHLSVGGDFTKINRKARSHYARFTEGVDTQAPTVPGQPTATGTSPSTARITWAASRDNTVSDIVYSVFRDGGSTAVGQVTSSSSGSVTFNDSGMLPGSTHTWRIRASDGSNTSGLSASSNSVTLGDPGYAVLTQLAMFDGDANGKVDRVVATFSGNVSCAAPCLSPWTFAKVPSGGTLQSVSTSGRDVTLRLKEGSGAPSTAPGGFTVSLAAAANGVVDSSSRQSRFGSTTPDDKAGPVPTDIASTKGAKANVMEPGDTFTATFSEPIAPASVNAANVKEYDQNGAGNDQIIIVGLTDGAMDLGSDKYVTAPNGTIVFANSTLTLTSGNTKIKSTIVGSCSGTACGAVGPGAKAVVTFRPEPTLTDVSGNGAVGSHTEAQGMY